MYDWCFTSFNSFQRYLGLGRPSTSYDSLCTELFGKLCILLHVGMSLHKQVLTVEHFDQEENFKDRQLNTPNDVAILRSGKPKWPEVSGNGGVKEKLQYPWCRFVWTVCMLWVGMASSESSQPIPVGWDQKESRKVHLKNTSLTFLHSLYYCMLVPQDVTPFGLCK